MKLTTKGFSKARLPQMQPSSILIINLLGPSQEPLLCASLIVRGTNESNIDLSYVLRMP